MVPPKSRYVPYYRVSTARQGKSGLGLEAQQATVKEFLTRVGGVAVASFTEVESGRNLKRGKQVMRPELEAALTRCKQTGGTLLVAKLDRLSRNAAFLLNLRDSGVPFEALDIQGANTLTVGVLALVAQNEAEAISARTKAALAARRARGLPMGQPRDMRPYAARGAMLGRATNRAKAAKRAQMIAPLIAEARANGRTSLRSIAAYLNELSITTPFGKQWTATAVANAMRMLAAEA